MKRLALPSLFAFCALLLAASASAAPPKAKVDASYKASVAYVRELVVGGTAMSKCASKSCVRNIFNKIDARGVAANRALESLWLVAGRKGRCADAAYAAGIRLVNLQGYVDALETAVFTNDAGQGDKKLNKLGKQGQDKGYKFGAAVRKIHLACK